MMKMMLGWAAKAEMAERARARRARRFMGAETGGEAEFFRRNALKTESAIKGPLPVRAWGGRGWRGSV
jgi:hypothetical protein